MQDNDKEFTLLAVLIGIVVGIIMTAANVYLGLYAGMTVSASIPAAVIASGILHGLLKQKGLLQANIVQTMTSAGESLAAGVIFTLPALVLIGIWKNFEFLETTLIAIAGGLLGVIFMIPLRKTLIKNEKKLIYPEGVACAHVLKSSSSSDKSGLKHMSLGLLLGAIIKFMVTGLKLFTGSFEKAFFLAKRSFLFGIDISPALIGVGYIVKLEVALLVFLGGALGWFVIIPILSINPDIISELQATVDKINIENASMLTWAIWDKKVRFIGVGAMLVGGVISIMSVRHGMADGLRQIVISFKNRNKNITQKKSETDISLTSMSIILCVCFLIMLGIYSIILESWGMSLFSTVIMIIATFPFVAVSSYIVGLVGSSNNPVSGITIGILLCTASLFFAFGLEGDKAIYATLGVAAIICCACCTAGDCSQDLKTGSLLGATPKYQQWAQIIGIVIPAFTIAPVLTLLHNTYGIGDGLKAPQATLFKTLAECFFDPSKDLPTDMIFYGVILGFILLFADKIIAKTRSNIRLHIMPVAIGIYLPLSLATAVFIGGLIRYLVDKKRNTNKSENNPGVLFSSGLIAGEAIIGVILAGLIYTGYINLTKDPATLISNLDKTIFEWGGLAVLIGLAVTLYRKSIKD